ncbi:phage portal protein [Bradyrhizobium sp. PUT101]|uniref:phage portal protein n=1 Tax=Bradyrhizobium sp. PUT101 TaxID=3447427 RepID=UPI003F82A8D0
MREVSKTARAVQPTLLDRVIGAIDPERGLKRLRARTMLALAGGYKGGRKDRRPTKLWRPEGASADADTLPDLPDLRARTRDLERNAPLATGAIATATTNVAADGLQLQANIDVSVLGITPERADEMEREQEREWRLFCKTADFTRVQHMDELAPMAFRASLQSGDVFIVRRFRKDAGDAYGTKLLVIEADRVSNPGRAADTDEVAGGVHFSTDGVPIGYHVSDRHPGALVRPGQLNWTEVPARSGTGLRTVIHLYDRLRPELSRGVPYLAPVIEHLKQLSDYADAEVSAAVVSAMFTGFIKSDVDDSADPIVGEKDAALAENELKLGNGALLSLNPGEDVTFANPARPNEKFDPFFQAFCRQIGVALELPFELLIKHFTASYSASRAALEMAWQFFRKKRGWLARNFYAEVYGWMMDEAVASGRLDRPGYFDDPLIREAYLGAEWIGPQRASLMPKQESDADKQDVEAGFKTIEQVCMERTGGEFEKKHAQRVKEQRLRREGGLLAAQPGAAAPSPAQGSEDDPADDDAAEDGAEDGADGETKQRAMA